MRTAVAAGLLALALGGGIPAVAIVPVSAARASTRMDDCDHGGLLGTVTGTVCHVVDDVVHGLSEGGSSRSPDPLPSGEGAADSDSGSRTGNGNNGNGNGNGNNGNGKGNGGNAEASSGVEEAPAETESTRTPDAAPSATGTQEGKRPSSTAKDGERSSGGTQTPPPQDPADACRSASAKCADLTVAPLSEEPQRPGAGEETVRPTTSPSPSPSATPARDQGVPSVRKTPVPAPTDRPPFPVPLPETRTLTTDVGEPASPRPKAPVVDAEAPRVELLWPAPLMQELQRQMPDAQPVTPSRSSDTASTVLTTAVLVSAILAVRLLYSRRKIRESIPFEPAPPGHHRVA
ncbi:hypothetical protein [Streptosporangium sp. NPDC048865]|uniref:hypothetical protein n=1 Tax=Streptosporangium sp. NPDC048865 TaxID=3155766 RepID=UPI0034455868